MLLSEFRRMVQKANKCVITVAMKGNRAGAVLGCLGRPL